MKQLVRAVNAPIHAKVTIPGSKSITNRALLLAALADGVSELSDILLSDDTLAFIEALRALGISIQLDTAARSCIVAGNHGQFPKTEAAIWCHSAGTVARFLTAACAASPGQYYFDATPQLRQRPLDPLLQLLVLQGAKIQPEHATQLPFTLVGCDRLHGGEIEITDETSSQFLSALLMIAPYAKSSVIISTPGAPRRSYIDMTCAMMGEFGVLVRRMHYSRFSVPVPQCYHARDYTVEADFSTASYFFAAAAVTGGSIAIPGMKRADSIQGDVAFLSVLEEMGCFVNETSEDLVLQGPTQLQGVDVNMEDFSDTFMTLAALAPFAATPTTIRHIGHTRLQESNRISAMCRGLQAMQIQVEEGQDWITIYPGEPKAAEVDSHQDHRIAMAFSIIGLRVPGVVIDGAECVTKTCPEFFELWGKL